MQQEERLRHLEQELMAARHEIPKLKAVIGSNSIVEQADLNEWIKPKNSKAGELVVLCS
jgi:hypothetical protein